MLKALTMCALIIHCWSYLVMVSYSTNVATGALGQTNRGLAASVCQLISL